MTIHKKDTPFTLGIPDYSKRCRVYNDDGKWMDTLPIHITEIPSLTQSLNVLIQTLKQELLSQNNTHNKEHDDKKHENFSKKQNTTHSFRKRNTNLLIILLKIKINHRRSFSIK